MISVLESGGYPIINYVPDGTDRRTGSSRIFYENASPEMINYFPKDYMLSLVKEVDHTVNIIASNIANPLEGINPELILERQKSAKFFMTARTEKENRGEFTWTMALYGTEAQAESVGMSIDEYWEQIINACYLNDGNPIETWKNTFGMVNSTIDKLNALDIDKLHIEGEDIDLFVKIGEKRKWLGGLGRNIPSFEIFISPDWRGTNGWVKFNQAIKVYGSEIDGMYLEFKHGIITKSTATKNEELFKTMINTENANKVGEFSLTDRRISRITRSIGEILYDENIGGEFGNTHIAVGSAYKDSYTGDISSLNNAEWENLGFNQSSVHTDLISTTNRKVTAFLKNGKEIVIYENGEFTI